MNRMRFTFSLLALVVALFVVERDARAVSGEWSKNEHVEMRLVSAVQAVGERETSALGLQFRMKPGWKLYWRSPGDAGFPPGRSGAAPRTSPTCISIGLHQRAFNLELETLGYKEEVVLPLTARARTLTCPTTVRTKVDYLTCKDICIPYQASAELRLPTGVASASSHAHLLDQFRARVPGDGKRHRIVDIRGNLLLPARM